MKKQKIKRTNNVLFYINFMSITGRYNTYGERNDENADNLFNSNGYIFNIPVIIKTNDKLYVIAENPKQVEEFAKYVAIHS